MPEQFTVFNARNRDANVQYASGTYQIPADSTDTKVRFTLTNIDIINEPSTTRFFWSIEGAEDGVNFDLIAGGDVSGRDGVPPIKTSGTLERTIHNHRGWTIRGSLYFVSANDQRKRFGVEAQTF